MYEQAISSCKLTELCVRYLKLIVIPIIKIPISLLFCIIPNSHIMLLLCNKIFYIIKSEILLSQTKM